MAALHALTQCLWTSVGAAAAVRLPTMTVKIKTARDMVFSIFFLPRNCLLLCPRANAHHCRPRWRSKNLTMTFNASLDSGTSTL